MGFKLNMIVAIALFALLVGVHGQDEPTVPDPAPAPAKPAATAASICTANKLPGLVANPDDTRCKQYARCFVRSTVLQGAFFNCTGTTLFNPAVGMCVTGFTCPAPA